MHHAKEVHEFKKPPGHAFAILRKGDLTDLFRRAFPKAHFNEERQEWRIDRDPTQVPEQGRRVDAFATEHEVLHRY